MERFLIRPKERIAFPNAAPLPSFPPSPLPSRFANLILPEKSPTLLAQAGK